MGRTIGVIRARMGSDRLPGSIFAPLGGRPLLALLRARVAAARVDEWWLATSGRPTDDVTEAWGFELGLRVHRGAEPSPLAAYHAIAGESGADWIVAVRASDPFVDAALIDALLDARDATRESKEADAIRIGGADPSAAIASAGHRTAVLHDTDARPTLPCGYRVEAFRRRALSGATTGGASRPVEPHTCAAPADWPCRPHWRWSIESYEDLAMARSAFRVFGGNATTIAYPEMVAALDAHPEIGAMNGDGDANDGPQGGARTRAEAATRWRR